MHFLLDMHLHDMHILRMTFDQFLTMHGITNAEAALRLSRDVTLIGRYRARRVTPSPQIIADIVDWSEGAITPRDLLAAEKPAEVS